MVNTRDSVLFVVPFSALLNAGCFCLPEYCIHWEWLSCFDEWEKGKYGCSCHAFFVLDQLWNGAQVLRHCGYPFMEGLVLLHQFETYGFVVSVCLWQAETTFFCVLNENIFHLEVLNMKMIQTENITKKYKLTLIHIHVKGIYRNFFFIFSMKQTLNTSYHSLLLLIPFILFRYIFCPYHLHV